MKRGHRIKYVSVKLPASLPSYPVDEHGAWRLPNYTPAYLRKHGRKLFNILFNDVPAEVYKEMVKCINAAEGNKNTDGKKKEPKEPLDKV